MLFYGNDYFCKVKIIMMLFLVMVLFIIFFVFYIVLMIIWNFDFEYYNWLFVFGKLIY